MSNELTILRTQKENIKLAYIYGIIEGSEALRIYSEINEKILKLTNQTPQ